MRSLLIVAAALCLMNFRCEKDVGYGPVMRGKLVYTSCASSVVQLLDTAYFNLGEINWQQSPSSPVYNHVFTIRNKCSFNGGNLAIGEEFYFRRTEHADRDCMVCMLADNPPKVSFNIIRAEK